MAVLLILGNSGRAEEKLVAFKAPDARGLRLFDQAVKLSRRYDHEATKQTEPLKSMLIELSDYHDDEQAGFLDAQGSTRSSSVDIGPWALARLARLEWQLNDFDRALSAYERLGQDFIGRDVAELDSAAAAPLKEKAEIASLRGRLRVLQSFLSKTKNEDLSEQAFDLILDFQKDYGVQTMVCPEPCGTYGSVALRALWDLLDALKAPAEEWSSRTKKLEKYEKDSSFAAAVFLALSQSYGKLGKDKESKEFYRLALKKYATAATLSVLPEGALKNLISCASPRF